MFNQANTHINFTDLHEGRDGQKTTQTEAWVAQMTLLGISKKLTSSISVFDI